RGAEAGRDGGEVDGGDVARRARWIHANIVRGVVRWRLSRLRWETSGFASPSRDGFALGSSDCLVYDFGVRRRGLTGRGVALDTGRSAPRGLVGWWVVSTRVIRPEIQALWVLAVVLVVVCHIWPVALPGGFVGVDVFF